MPARSTKTQSKSVLSSPLWGALIVVTILLAVVAGAWPMNVPSARVIPAGERDQFSAERALQDVGMITAPPRAST